MKRKNIANEDYAKVFPRRLRELMEETGTKQQQLADYIHRQRQTVSLYCDGSSSPDWETLAVIAKYFNVCTDYLLGLSNAPGKHLSAVDELNLSPSIVSVFLELKSLDRTPLENRSPHDQHIADVNLLLDAIKIYTQKFL